jgi:hypothetical protein
VLTLRGAVFDSRLEAQWESPPVAWAPDLGP